MREQMIRD